MDIAKERRSGRKVFAADASPHGDYRCPVCDAGVFLRRGEYYVPHFAHKSGLALPECELYFGSDDIKHPWPSLPGSASGYPGPDEKQYPSLALSIEIEPKATAKGQIPREWGLRLTVPRCQAPQGGIAVDCGHLSARKIELSSLMLAPLWFPVNANALDFGVTWFSPEVDARYREALAERIAGLSTLQINAFAVNSEKHKPSVKALSLEGSYYFVWHRHQMPLQIPTAIFEHQLADNGDWACALITLPSGSDVGLREWIRGVCGLGLVPPKRTWKIIFPVAYGIDVNGQITVPPSESMIVSTEAIGESSPDSTFECVAGPSRASVPIATSARHSFEIITRDKTSSVPLVLIWDHQTLPAIARVPYPERTNLLSVLVRFGSVVGGATICRKLHEGSCREAFEKIRLHELELLRVECPCGVRGLFRWRIAQESWQQIDLRADESVSTKSGLALLSSVSTDQVNTVLKERKSEAVFSFGPFGEFSSHPEPRSDELHSKHFLRQMLRERIIWFCKVNQAYTNSSGSRVDEMDDEHLMERFAQVQPAAWLIAHKRWIEADLGMMSALKVLQ